VCPRRARTLSVVLISGGRPPDPRLFERFALSLRWAPVAVAVGSLRSRAAWVLLLIRSRCVFSSYGTPFGGVGLRVCGFVSAEVLVVGCDTWVVWVGPVVVTMVHVLRNGAPLGDLNQWVMGSAVLCGGRSSGRAGFSQESWVVSTGVGSGGCWIGFL
jgi:hypothetical protein